MTAPDESGSGERGSGSAARLRRALRAVGDFIPSVPWWSYWPVLLGPATVVAVYVAWSAGVETELQKGPLELAAIVLTGVALLCWGVQALQSRDPVAILVTFLALAFFQREIHFEGSDEILYVMALSLLVWAFAWRNRLPEALALGRRWPWLAATGLTYLLSQLVARRVFSGFPLEYELHIWVEEAIENTAHVMLVVSAFAHRWPRRPGARASSKG
jgi:hypothetical protein